MALSKMQEAVRKAQNGYAVFPLAENQKIPLIAGGSGCLDATCDVGIVSAWWEATPDANIGVLCGPRPEGSGVWVLDVDGEDGKASLAALVAQHGPLPETLVVDTPSGGQHYYFAYPRGRTIRNRVGIVGPDGQRVRHLDVRSARGYVVAPPSVVGGRPYRVVQRHAPVDAPDWLLNLVAPDEPQRPAWVPRVVPSVEVGGDALRRRRVAFCRASLETACARIAGMREGDGRNDAVNKALLAFSGYAAAGYLDDADALSRIEAAAAASGLPQREIAQLFRGGGGWDKGYAEPRHPDLEERRPPGWRGEPRSAPPPIPWEEEAVPSVERGGVVVLDEDDINRRLSESEAEPPPVVEGEVRLTETGNARRLVRRFGGALRYVADVGSWAVWEGSRWALDVRGRVIERCKQVADEIIEEGRVLALRADEMEAAPAADGIDPEAKKKHVEELRGRAAALVKWGTSSESMARLKATASAAQSEPAVVVERADFDRQAEMLNLQNGIVDLRHGRLLPHTPDALLMHQANAEWYDDRAYECPKWSAFLRTVFCGDEELIAFVQRAAGMSMVGHGPKDALFILYGMGANGKSTFVSVMVDILGSYAVTTRVQTFLQKGGSQIPADVAALAGARAVTMAEPNAGDQLATGLIKECLGEGKITARFLNQNFFSFTPTFAPWLSCNHKPIVKDTSDGTWRRMQLIGFNHRFEEKDQVKNYDKVLLAEERDAIFAWMLAGARAYLGVGLQPPKSVRDDVATYREEMDLLAEFIQEYLERGNFTAPYEETWQAFRGWTRDNNDEKAWSKKRFTREMGDRGIRRSPGKGNGQPFVGVRLVKARPVDAGPPPMWHERD